MAERPNFFFFFFFQMSKLENFFIREIWIEWDSELNHIEGSNSQILGARGKVKRSKKYGGQKEKLDSNLKNYSKVLLNVENWYCLHWAGELFTHWRAMIDWLTDWYVHERSGRKKRGGGGGERKKDGR